MHCFELHVQDREAGNDQKEKKKSHLHITQAISIVYLNTVYKCEEIKPSQ